MIVEAMEKTLQMFPKWRESTVLTELDPNIPNDIMNTEQIKLAIVLNNLIRYVLLNR